ncbi:hypothetical protein G9P44_001628 [Scheffersomyces stipitis]|nr:hypothetical protein G9P44_001628 [Scheffersomyces stipitis]
MPSNEELTTHKVATIISLVLSIWGNAKYAVSKSPFDPDSGFSPGDTPFSGSSIVTFVFWIILYILQITYVFQIFLPDIDSGRLNTTVLVGWHFFIFNAGTYLWSVLFGSGHYFWSEVVVLINFFNILVLYFNHRTYSIKPLGNWLLIHLPTSAFPFSWLFYAIFWNGAVLFKSTGLAARIIANVIVWDFLLVPGFLVLVFGDWGIGISSSIITFGLGLGQIFTKVIALQWIFSFVISGILLLLSVFAAVTGTTYVRTEVITVVETNESAPLITNSNTNNDSAV